MNHGSRDRVLKEVEAQERRAGILRQVELVDVDRVHGDEVVVRPVAPRRRRADVATLARVVDQRESVAGQIAAVTYAGRQFVTEAGRLATAQCQKPDAVGASGS